MSAASPPAHVAIIGLGLMGGSLARALKNLPRPPHVLASTLDAAIVTRAVEDGVADEVTIDPRAILERAELVVYATPVGATIEMLALHRDLLRVDATIIDVGSVKQPVEAAARAAGLAEQFVGCHPMCGRERSGYDASSPNLFAGAIVWIVTGADSAPVERVMSLWRSVGARPRRIEADAHDRLVAWTSHLPQILASALGGALGAASFRPDALGPGGVDMTRLARSPERLWTEILVQNRAMLEAPLAEVGARLSVFADAIARADAREIERLLLEGREWADQT